MQKLEKVVNKMDKFEMLQVDIKRNIYLLNYETMNNITELSLEFHNGEWFLTTEVIRRHEYPYDGTTNVPVSKDYIGLTRGTIQLKEDMEIEILKSIKIDTKNKICKINGKELKEVGWLKLNYSGNHWSVAYTEKIKTRV